MGSSLPKPKRRLSCPQKGWIVRVLAMVFLIGVKI